MKSSSSVGAPFTSFCILSLYGCHQRPPSLFFLLNDYSSLTSMSHIAFSSSPAAELRQQGASLEMNMDKEPKQQNEFGDYPVRVGQQDCSYYIQTGVCKFGTYCRFNHPPNRALAIAAAGMEGRYPERIGQPECKHYLTTGTCKFGATCKFNHSRHRAVVAGRVALSILGYPIRPNEIDCAYYMRKGQCKFGSFCKFNHPLPSGLMIPADGSAVYPPIHSSTGQMSFHKAPIMPSPQWKSPPHYAPVFLASVSGWNTHNDQVDLVLPSENQQQTSVNGQSDGISGQTKSINVGPELGSGSLPFGCYAFPERPGQPECQFYMKTGDCKFGAICKFHHPKERGVQAPDCVLSPIGLPLRPGKLLCSFYSRYGTCKFGSSCKFDHPMTDSAYNAVASPSTNNTVVHHFMGSSSGAVESSLDGLVGAGSIKDRQLSLPEARQKPYGDTDHHKLIKYSTK